MGIAYQHGAPKVWNFSQFDQCEDECINHAAGTTVFLLDNESGTLLSAGKLLRAAGYNVRAFTSASKFLDEHDPAVPGCAIIEVEFREVDGLQIQELLAREGIERPVIFVTRSSDVATGVRAMKAGAIDFLLKPVRSRELLSAIDRAVDEDTKRRHARRTMETASELLATLTPRERQVLLHVAIGLSNKQIACELGIVEQTIKVHRGRVTAKLGMRSVAELVRFSIYAGLLPSSWTQSLQPSDVHLIASRQVS